MWWQCGCSRPKKRVVVVTCTSSTRQSATALCTISEGVDNADTKASEERQGGWRKEGGAEEKKEVEEKEEKWFE